MLFKMLIIHKEGLFYKELWFLTKVYSWLLLILEESNPNIHKKSSYNYLNNKQK